MHTIKLDGRGSGYVDRIDLENYLAQQYPALELDQFNMRVSFVQFPLREVLILIHNSAFRIAGNSSVRKS